MQTTEKNKAMTFNREITQAAEQEVNCHSPHRHRKLITMLQCRVQKLEQFISTPDRWRWILTLRLYKKKKKKQFERRLLNIIHRILRWRMMSCFSTLLLHRRPFKGWTDTGWNESKHCTDRPPAVSQTPLVKSACLSQHLSLNIMFTGLAGPSKVVLWYYNSVYEWLSLSSSFGLIFFFFFLGAWIQRLWCLTCWQFMLLLISFYA